MGVRPLKLHCARHTWATTALQAGKNVRWVAADQLGHAKPALTLEVYAHAMRDDETDLSFAEFGGTERPDQKRSLFAKETLSRRDSSFRSG